MLKSLRRTIVETAFAGQEGHIPSAFSILDILWVLYDSVLRIDPANPSDPDRDRFILSKGHGCLALYAVLAEKGFIPREELRQFASYRSRLGGHPHRGVPGIEASTGSLGHGLPIAVGVALGLKIRNRNKPRVYCLIGDGEANEGSVWEAASLAVHHGLTNLICIVDDNRSSDHALDMGDFGEKFEGFEWQAVNIDGHDHAQILTATRLPRLQRTAWPAPLCIVARTIKGHGCKPMENNPEWHRKAPSTDNLNLLIEELS